MLEHSLITALTWRDVQGSGCFIPYKLDFREFSLLIVVVVALVLIECKLLAASGNPGEEVDEGDNVARPISERPFWPSFKSVFDE